MSESHRFLMCKPDHFKVSYVINPWMSGNIDQTSLKRAIDQWHKLHAAVAALARVELVEPQPGFPDMPFTANAGFLLENTAILSRFRCVERQGEEPFFDDWFSSHGFKVVRMPKDIPFEGAGDALIDRGASRVWAAWGHRSARESHDLLRRHLQVELTSLRLIDSRFYHLDTCFCPLERGYVMYYPGAFDADSIRTIEQRIRPEFRISVDEDDAVKFACNAVNIGDTIIMNESSAPLRNRLSSLGFIVIETELNEFLKAGGAAKCLTLRLDEPRNNSHTVRITA